MVSAKYFSERLNNCLDEMGAPAQERERAAVLSKILDIPKQQAWSLLEGYQVPSQELITKIANEFDVDPDWIAGDK